jgi:hypothetical protein
MAGWSAPSSTGRRPIAQVLAFCKISENRHTFARLRYVKDDGCPRSIRRTFWCARRMRCLLVETKAQQQAIHPNVQRKLKAALAWCERINAASKLSVSSRRSSTVCRRRAPMFSWRFVDVRGDLGEAVDASRRELELHAFGGHQLDVLRSARPWAR